MNKKCVYCHKKMIYPTPKNNRKDNATIEHLNEKPPFYVKDGLKIKDIVICCGSCNSSRRDKQLSVWFKSDYCKSRNINGKTVAKPVKDYLKRKKL